MSSPADQDVLNRAYVIVSVSRLSHNLMSYHRRRSRPFFEDKLKTILVFNLISTVCLALDEIYSWAVCHLLNYLGSRQFFKGDSDFQ